MKTILLAAVLLFVVPWGHAEMENSSVNAEQSCGWLLSFHGKPAGDAVKQLSQDRRFRELLGRELPHSKVWWHAQPLPDGVPVALSGGPASFQVESGRFIAITGTFPTEGELKSLLWCDTGAKRPALYFVFLSEALGGDRVGQATIDIYSKVSEGDAHFPPQFISAVLAWEKKLGIKSITKVTVHHGEHDATDIPASFLNVR